MKDYIIEVAVPRNDRPRKWYWYDAEAALEGKEVIDDRIKELNEKWPNYNFRRKAWGENYRPIPLALAYRDNQELRRFEREHGNAQ